MLVSAPLAFVVLLLLGLAAGAVIARLYYRVQIANAKSHVELLRDQLKEAGMKPEHPPEGSFVWSKAEW